MAEFPSEGFPETQAAAWEAVSLLKRQQRRRCEAWAQVLAVKESELEAARERQAGLELEAAELRRKLQTQEELCRTLTEAVHNFLTGA